MIIDGRLTGPEVTTIDGERTFQAGDRILALRNDKRRGLTNGGVGTVTAVNADERTVSVQLDTGARCEVPTKYLDAGHLAHGYATTAHKAQGLTCDRALLLGNDALYRELGYVGLSRGRLGNHLYVVGRDRDETPEHTSPHLERGALEVVTDALPRSRGQQLAIDFAGKTAGHHEPDLGALLRERRTLRDLLSAGPPDPSTELAALKRQRSDTAALLAEAEERPQHSVPEDFGSGSAAPSPTAWSWRRRSNAIAQGSADSTLRATSSRTKLTTTVSSPAATKPRSNASRRSTSASTPSLPDTLEASGGTHPRTSFGPSVRSLTRKSGRRLSGSQRRPSRPTVSRQRWSVRISWDLSPTTPVGPSGTRSQR